MRYLVARGGLLYLVDSQTGGVGDPDVAGCHAFHAVKEPRPVFVLEFIHGFQSRHRHPACSGDHALGDLRVRHLHTEKQHAMALSGNLVDDIQCKLGFAHGWPRGDKHQICRFNAAGHSIKLLNASE